MATPQRLAPIALIIAMSAAVLPAVTATTIAQPASAASASGTALAVIATVDIQGSEVLAVGAGPHFGDAIYAVEGNNFEGNLYRINPSTFSIDDSVPVGKYPLGIAVSEDDTVYVVNATSDDMSVVSGATMSVSSTVMMPAGREEPQAIALSRVTDDSIFVTTKAGGAGPTFHTFGANTLTRQSEQTLSGAPNPYGLTVSPSDDVYIASYGGNRVYLVDGATRALTNSAAITRPLGVAISDDDTVYVASETLNTLSAYPADDSTAISTVAVGLRPQGVTVGGDGRVFVANSNSGSVSLVDPVTMTEDETVAVGSSPTAIARTGDGLIVVGNKSSKSVSVIASVSPALNSSSGRAESTATISLGGLPTGVVVDDSTIGSISFDGVVLSGWARVAGTNSWSGPVPDGTGSVPVSVSLQGGNSADLGTFTYTVDPPPVIPAGPPTNVSGLAGDRSATITWAAPVSSGSFPVTTYQATSTPVGRSCIVATTSCTVTGLTNGVNYTFTVRALTGAGWSPFSQPSAIITPQAPIVPTLMISGSRGEVRGKPGVVVSGTSTGLGMGAILAPWTRTDNRAKFTEGRARILVDMSGEFTWQRRSQQTVHIQMRTPDGALRSNILTITR